jgi:hypothetical protein
MDAIFDNKKGIYAHPLIGICNARSNDPTIAPQKDICSISVFMINSNMKLREVLQEHMVTHLLQVCKHELELNDLPEIFLVSEPTVGGGTSFGEFTDDGIEVVSKGRHPMDVMRTLAHELVHWKQRVENMPMDGSDGSDTENQANAVAGIIMRKFGQQYPHYFIDTLP